MTGPQALRPSLRFGEFEFTPALRRLERAWPDAVVVEAALRFHMVALRRALGDGEGGKRFITTVPGRGYCFVGALHADTAVSAALRAHGAPRPLPAAPTRVVGRHEVV